MGAGIAGCLLAWRLQAAGQRVVVIGDSHAPSASAVAAGVINPVTGRWAVKSWRIDDLLPEAEGLYRQLEAELNLRVYHPMPLRRFCQNEADLKRIGRRLRNPRYANVLGALHPQGDSPSAIQDPHGSFDILRAAYVDLPELLTALRRRLPFIDARFHHAALQRRGTLWHYEGFTAPRVIFCEGAAVVDNPWFDSRALAPVKGETLLLEYPGLELPHSIYHHRKWLLPYGAHRYRIGATYSEQFKSAAPTASAAKELLEGAHAFLGRHRELHIITQLAGIRPSTRDARPLLGRHPSEPGLYLFNGLGSKGASVAPLMSRHFAEHLLHGTPLEAEVDLRRFAEA